MPSVAQSTQWFVRIAWPHADIPAKLNLVLQWIDLSRILAIGHTGDTSENEHMHFVIELKTNLQKQSFDTRLKNIFPGLKGNGSYSTKVWDGRDEACSYMFHEETEKILANKGFGEDDLTRFRNLNESTKKIVELAKQKASGRRANILVDQIKKEGTHWGREKIFWQFQTWIREGEMYDPGDFKLKSLIQEVYARTISHEVFREYGTMRFRKMFD